jgi:hypothetical protein
MADRDPEALRDILASIDAGELEATDTERAYIAGALHGLTGTAPDAPGASFRT